MTRKTMVHCALWSGAACCGLCSSGVAPAPERREQALNLYTHLVNRTCAPARLASEPGPAVAGALPRQRGRKELASDPNRNIARRCGYPGEVHRTPLPV